MCKKYRYLAYYEIPSGTIKFIENICGMNVYSLTMPEINNFMNDMDVYYREQNKKIENYIDG